MKHDKMKDSILVSAIKHANVLYSLIVDKKIKHSIVSVAHENTNI